MLNTHSLIPLAALTLCSLSSSAFAADNTIRTGYFIDAPVTGLFYKTSSNLSGITNKGAYQFSDGDIVSFYLGKDEDSYLLSRLSSQEVITPTLASTKPSRSINMTRLLLSLDSTPEDRQEILLLSELLANPEFQKNLNQLDLNILNSEMVKPLNIELVSTKEAVEHLNQSQKYIEQHFASDKIIYSPLNQRLKNIIIKKRDYYGRVCAYDLRFRNHPKYRSPIGEITYKVTNHELIEYPDVGDMFNGCNLKPNPNAKVVRTPAHEMIDDYGVSGCAKKGCTRNDLNGFAIDDYNDDGDWKYRSLAINFDPTTLLLMEKTQGLGQTVNIHHRNLTEEIWFTYPEKPHSGIPYEGIWQETTYKDDQISEMCLLIKNGTVKTTPLSASHCPENVNAYQNDKTQQYADMWWVSPTATKANIGQLNIAVRWNQKSGTPANFTTWEYLPAGKNWDAGILYRYQQTVTKQTDGSDQLNTHAISEYFKVTGVTQ